MSLAEFYICNGINPYDSDSFDAFFGGGDWEAERLQDFYDEDSDFDYSFDDDDEDETDSTDSADHSFMAAGEELFVYGVRAGVDVERLKEEFSSCGKVLHAENTGKGYAFVTMATQLETQVVLRAYGVNGALLLGKKVRVEVSKRNKKGEASGPRVSKCKNGRHCSFKPKCRFFHPEGGNSKGAGKTSKVVMTASKGTKMTSDEGKDMNSEEKVEMMVCQYGGRSWERANKKMLASVDEETYKGFIQEQVDLLGGCKRFYNVVARSLAHESLIGFIAEDQKALYKWRSKFFHEKLKCTYFGDRPGEGESTFFWTTDGHDDAHCMDTLPYQITENFDEVMKLAASTVKLDVTRERIYLESWEDSPGKFFEYERWEDSEASYDDEEWEDENEDHAELLENGKLPDGHLFDCENCKVFESEHKDCGSRKAKYEEYLLGSETIKQKYVEWRKGEDVRLAAEKEEEDERLAAEKKEDERLAAEKKEDERLAAEKEEEDKRLLAEKEEEEQ